MSLKISGRGRGERAAVAVFFFSSSLAFAQSADFFLSSLSLLCSHWQKKRCRREGKVSQRFFFYRLSFFGGREGKRI